MKLKQLNHAPSSPISQTDGDNDKLRSHLQNALNGLPQDLPAYNKEQLLGQCSVHITLNELTATTDDLCSLLHSPLFLYAMRPRVRRAKQAAEASRIRMLTPESMNDGRSSPEINRKPDNDVDMENLSMGIQWDGSSWTTRLFYGESTLVEGRQRAPRKAGSAQSFRWFCDEARFLRYEFSAREHAASVRLGTAIDTGSLDTLKSNEKAGGARKSRIVKLKISPRKAQPERGARLK
jgi:hypothetical protein